MARPSISKEQWTVARAIWESDPVVTFAEIAEDFGVTRQAVQLHARRHGWVKRLDKQTVSDLAHAAADSKLTGSPADGSKPAGSVVADTLEKRITRALPDLPLGASPEDAQKAAEAAAIDRRAEVLGTHRKELLAARTLLYGAIKSKVLDEAKQVKIAAEAMKIIQDAERKAWGLDSDEKGGRPQVQVIVHRRAGKPNGH
jgi:hypothetical protein